MKKFDDAFGRFDTIRTDGETDGRTDGFAISISRIAFMNECNWR